MDSTWSRPCCAGLNIRHEWHVEHAEDGSLYGRLLRCGKNDDERTRVRLWCLVRPVKLGTAVQVVQVTPAVGGREYPLLQNKQREAPNSCRSMLALHSCGPPAPPTRSPNALPVAACRAPASHPDSQALLCGGLVPVLGGNGDRVSMVEPMNSKSLTLMVIWTGPTGAEPAPASMHTS